MARSFWNGGYIPKHVARGRRMPATAKAVFYGAAASATALGGMAVIAAPAGAATGPMNVEFLVSGSGSSGAVYSGDPVLTVGSPSSSAYAEMDLVGVAGTAAPASEPSFESDFYYSGSPHWVIELNNGQSLIGYPSNSQLNGTDMAWSVGNGGPYTDYQTAYTNAGASSTTVKDAFIIADGGQPAGTMDLLTDVTYGTESGAAEDPALCYNGCAWQKLGLPAGYDMDVKGRVAKSGTPIIAWHLGSGDPAGDFTVVPASGGTGTYQIEYTPYTSLGHAEAVTSGSSLTGAEAAYDQTTGDPLYCVSAVSSQSGTQAQLRGCAKTTNEWQDFAAVPKSGGGGHAMLEPTYGTPGVAAGKSPLALNDKGYGKNGSPIISYAATGTWNEEFYPAAG